LVLVRFLSEVEVDWVKLYLGLIGEIDWGKGWFDFRRTMLRWGLVSWYWLKKITRRGVGEVEFGLVGVKKWCDSYLLTGLARYRVGAMVFVLMMAICMNTGMQYLRFERGEFAKNVRSVNYWPMVPFVYFDFARELFDYGDYEQAQRVLGASTANSLPGMKRLFVRKYDDVFDYVNQPERLSRELGEVNEQLLETPYSTYWLMRKAELEARLMRDDALAGTVEMVRWIDPGVGVEGLGGM
jgi:hypothetical protein